MIRIAAWLVVLGSAAWVLQPVTDPAAAPDEARIRMDPEIGWSPEAPGEGRLFVLRVTASIHTPIMGVRGEVAGEELHFRRMDDRIFESMAAVPIGTTEPVAATIRVAYTAGGEEVFEERIPVTQGRYAHERLTVSPRFGSELGPADQLLLDQDREKARSVSRTAHRTPRIATDSVVIPRESLVTSGFGDGREFNGEISSRHMGLDLRGLPGDTVKAAARGIVALVDEFLLAGSLVYVNHGAGLISGYFHLSEQLVQVGDTVQPGTPVGRVGATGRVTGPHLHWVVRYGTTSVDPRSLLELSRPY